MIHHYQQHRSEFFELANMMMQDHLHYRVNRIAADTVVDEQSRQWFQSEGGVLKEVGAIGPPLSPPFDQVRWRRYRHLMSDLGILNATFRVGAVVLTKDGPTFFNLFSTKSYYMGPPMPGQLELTSDAEWPTEAELRHRQHRCCAYKRLSKEWYIELYYFDPG